MQYYHKKQPETIEAMFDDIATKYDITNGVLSCQLHRYWNNKFVAALPPIHPEASLTDLCCGTGEIAFRWLRRHSQANRATLIDFSEQMLACARTKGQKLFTSPAHDIQYIKADVHKLPLPDSYTDFASMAYGIRNVKQPSICFTEVHRILKPGGTFAILELTRPKQRWLAAGHRFYLKILLPLLGRLMTRNAAAYRYLGNSIGDFVDPEILKSELEKAHFSNVSIKSLSGGIATIITALRP
jgi:demethylmenaquinone methyltransferase/2-methoxy-6-polyprenyl-1,4-benzoquinol methylase